MNDQELRRAIEEAARDEVEDLNLFGEGLTALPLEIGRLTNLTKLDLRDNRLTALPPKIGQLTCLTSLFLRGNPLPIPPEILGLRADPAGIISYWLIHLEEE